MNGGFGGGKAQDKQTFTRVDRLPAEHVAEERAVRSRVLAVQNEMDAEDHRLPKSTRRRPMGTRSSDVIPEYWRGPAPPLPGRLLIVMSARSHVAPEALARGERAIHVGALLQDARRCFDDWRGARCFAR